MICCLAPGVPHSPAVLPGHRGRTEETYTSGIPSPVASQRLCHPYTSGIPTPVASLQLSRFEQQVPHSPAARHCVCAALTCCPTLCVCSTHLLPDTVCVPHSPAAGHCVCRTHLLPHTVCVLHSPAARHCVCASLTCCRTLCVCWAHLLKGARRVSCSTLQCGPWAAPNSLKQNLKSKIV